MRLLRWFTIREEHAPLVATVFLAVVHLALDLWQLTRGTRYIASHLTIDDTYYYLQTAWQTHQSGFVTFDGMHATSGVQIAWFGVAWILALVSPTKQAFLYAALSVGGLLNVLCYVPIWRIGRVLSTPALGALLCGMWMTATLGPIYSKGLENSLHGVVFWWASLEALRCLLPTGKEGPARLLPLAVALVANAWVRLDGGLFSAILFAGCAASLAYRSGDVIRFWQLHSRPFIAAVVVAMLGLGLQLSIYDWMAGSPMPTSAIVKSSGLHYPPETGGLARLIETLKLSTPPHFGGSKAALLAAVLMLWLGLVWNHRGQRERMAFWQLWALLAISVFAYHVSLVALQVPYGRYNTWYLTPMFVFWLLTFAGVVLGLLDSLRRNATAATIAASGVAIVAGAASGYVFYENVEALSQRRSYLTDLYEAALWVSTHSSTDTVFAAWNTGLLGFFSNRTFINLDGLVNALEYEEQVLSSSNVPEATRGYLRENGVDYIVDMEETEDASAVLGEMPLVRSFSRPGKWGGVNLWRVHPDADALLGDEPDTR